MFQRDNRALLEENNWIEETIPINYLNFWTIEKENRTTGMMMKVIIDKYREVIKDMDKRS